MNVIQVQHEIFVKLYVIIFAILPYSHLLKEDRDIIQDQSYSTDNDEVPQNQQLLPTNGKYEHFDSEWNPENVYSYDEQTPAIFLRVTNLPLRSNNLVTSYVDSEGQSSHNLAKREIDEDYEETKRGRMLKSNYLEEVHDILTKFVADNKIYPKRNSDTDGEHKSDSFKKQHSKGALLESSDFDYNDGKSINQDYKDAASLLDEAPVEGSDDHKEQKNIKREGKKPKSKNNKGPKVWDQWGKWSPCSVTCGAGKITRWRHCTSGACAIGEKEAQLKTCIFSPC